MGPKSDLQIFSELAVILGIDGYNDKSEDEWLRQFLKTESDFPDLDTIRDKEVYRFKSELPKIAFREQIENPKKNPFPTPTGKIEIYSNMFANMENPLIPPIPKYIEPWEGPRDKKIKDYPIQIVSPHSRARVNSQLDNIEKLKKLKNDDLWINYEDALIRGIEDGDNVVVFNQRGRIHTRARVTDSIMSGVASIDQGQWYSPDNQGTDLGSCVNVLTLDSKSPTGAFPCNTCIVQIERL